MLRAFPFLVKPISHQTFNINLIQKYFSLLLENGELPAAICFYTEGVRLVTGASPILDQLRQLEAQGVRLIVCSTCLETMALTGQAQAGIVGGMTDILEAQNRADKVITI
ncbi:MAG: hypothetical protein DPW18_20760 [Chloroflexi bacterium]|nr:hypothetical protein [Chloroflexota bacterium]MDL1945161.1 hypothetical protein [Chloroflexi bacterium CFX2]